MYYQLGQGGRAFWTLAVFIIWCFVTGLLMHITIKVGMDFGDVIRVGTRSVGINPAFSDVFKMLVAIIGFVMVPILTTVSIAKLNKRLKGTRHEQQ